MSNAGKRWMGIIAKCPCLIGSRGLDSCAGRVEVHHVAEGSGPRSDFSAVPLCSKHHDSARAGTGFHGMGKTFLKLFRVPGESEYGLLIWTNEEVEKLLWSTGSRLAA